MGKGPQVLYLECLWNQDAMDIKRLGLDSHCWRVSTAAENVLPPPF